MTHAIWQLKIIKLDNTLDLPNKPPLNEPSIVQINDKVDANIIDETLHKCTYCNNSYSTFGSLMRHNKICFDKTVVTQKYESNISKLNAEYKVNIDTVNAKCLSLETQIKLLEKNIANQNDMIKLLTINKDNINV